MADNEGYISLAEAADQSPYSQEYLSLRARQGKLRAVKQGRNWVTRPEWVAAYLNQTEETKEELKKATRVAAPYFEEDAQPARAADPSFSHHPASSSTVRPFQRNQTNRNTDKAPIEYSIPIKRSSSWDEESKPSLVQAAAASPALNPIANAYYVDSQPAVVSAVASGDPKPFTSLEAAEDYLAASVAPDAEVTEARIAPTVTQHVEEVEHKTEIFEDTHRDKDAVDQWQQFALPEHEDLAANWLSDIGPAVTDLDDEQDVQLTQFVHGFLRPAMAAFAAVILVIGYFFLGQPTTEQAVLAQNFDLKTRLVAGVYTVTGQIDKVSDLAQQSMLAADTQPDNAGQVAGLSTDREDVMEGVDAGVEDSGIMRSIAAGLVVLVVDEENKTAGDYGPAVKWVNDFYDLPY